MRAAFFRIIAVSLVVLSGSLGLPLDSVDATETITLLEETAWATPSMVLDAAGSPVIAYRYGEGVDDLRIIHCGDPLCLTGNTPTSPDTSGQTGYDPSLALDSAGNPVVSYFDGTNDDLKVLHCGDPTCSSGNTITSPDTAGDVGSDSSLALDAAGNPVVSYFDGTNDDLKVLHCGDPTCSSGNTITSPDTAGDVGSDSSLALDATGNPVVSYFDGTNDDLKVLHCGDPTCSSGNTITSPDTAGEVGRDPALILDAAGNPVIIYSDRTDSDAMILHCGDPTCSTGNTINATGTLALRVEAGSIVLDASGNPVVSYSIIYQSSGLFFWGPLGVLHCSDPNCASGIERRVIDWGADSDSSIALDAAGNPVVAMARQSCGSHFFPEPCSGTLAVFRCDDPYCQASGYCEGHAVTSAAGTTGDDVILGSPVVRRVSADAGDDLICVSSDHLDVKGGSGNDRIVVDVNNVGASGQFFRGDAPQTGTEAGDDELVFRAGTIINGQVMGDGHDSGDGGDDTIRFAGFLSGFLWGDGGRGSGGSDFIAVLPAGDVESVAGDKSNRDGGRDTITIVGNAGSVLGDDAGQSGGNDVIAITNGATVAVRDAGDALQGWVIGDRSNTKGGNDFFTLRGAIDRGVIGDSTGGAGGNDFMRIYPAAAIGGPIIGDGGPLVDGVFEPAPGPGGADTIVAFAGAIISGSVIGDSADGAGGDDKFSLSAAIAGSVIGDAAGRGGNDSIGIGAAATVGGNLVGDDTTGVGGNDVLDISGTVTGSVLGDRADGLGGNDIIYVRSTAIVGAIRGDRAANGGDDRVVVNAGGVVNGSIWGDDTPGNGGNDSIIVSGTVEGNINTDSADLDGGDDTIRINPAGVVNGNIYATKGTNHIIIHGTVNGDIECSPTTTLVIAGGTVTGDTSTC